MRVSISCGTALAALTYSQLVRGFRVSPRMVAPIIRQVEPAIVTFATQFKRSGTVEIGGRATAVKLSNGDVMLYSPTKPDLETYEALDKLGTVKYIICPNIEHHMFAGDVKDHYPNAKVIGVEGLEKKREDIKWAGIFGVDKEKTYGFEDELQYRYFGGSRNKDVAVFHKASKTMLTADLLFNLPPTEQYPGVEFGPLQRLAQGFLRPFTSAHRFFINTGLTTDKPSMQADARAVDQWDFTRIIPCHGNVIEGNGKEAWRDVYKDLL